MILNKCHYNNDAEYHLDTNLCAAMDATTVKLVGQHPRLRLWQGIRKALRMS
jgi:hypothetical protein